MRENLIKNRGRDRVFCLEFSREKSALPFERLQSIHRLSTRNLLESAQHQLIETPQFTLQVFESSITSYIRISILFPRV